MDKATEVALTAAGFETDGNGSTLWLRDNPSILVRLNDFRRSAKVIVDYADLPALLAPTLTADERAAIGWAINRNDHWLIKMGTENDAHNVSATLANLLDRTTPSSDHITLSLTPALANVLHSATILAASVTSGESQRAHQEAEKVVADAKGARS
jgi:hypothetical protein